MHCYKAILIIGDMENYIELSKRFVLALGGTFAVAKLCNVRAQSVSAWKTEGIPDARMMYLQVVRRKIYNQVKAEMDRESHEPE